MIFLKRFKCYISQVVKTNGADESEQDIRRIIQYRYKNIIRCNMIDIYVFVNQIDDSLPMDRDIKIRLLLFIYSRRPQLLYKIHPARYELSESYYILPHSTYSFPFSINLYFYSIKKFILHYATKIYMRYIFLYSIYHIPYYVEYLKDYKNSKHSKALVRMSDNDITVYINDDMANLNSIRDILSKLYYDQEDAEEIPSLTNHINKSINIITPTKRYLISLDLQEVKS